MPLLLLPRFLEPKHMKIAQTFIWKHRRNFSAGALLRLSFVFVSCICINLHFVLASSDEEVCL